MICIRSSKNRNKPNVCVVCVPSALYYLLCFYLFFSLSLFFFFFFFIHPLFRAPFPFAPSRLTVVAARNGRKRSETRRLVDVDLLSRRFSRRRERALGAGFSIFSHFSPASPSANAAPRVSSSARSRAFSRNAAPIPRTTHGWNVYVYTRSRFALNSVCPRRVGPRAI